jgi:hypothetical protein
MEKPVGSKDNATVRDDPAPPLPSEVEAFLGGRGRGFLVTLRPDGSPTIHPMTALFSGGRLVYNTYRKSAKARNVERDPRTCSLLFADYDEAPQRALLYKGRARALDPASFDSSGQEAARSAPSVGSSIPDRANARLEEGKRVLLGVDAEETAVLGRDGER